MTSCVEQIARIPGLPGILEFLGSAWLISVITDVAGPRPRVGGAFGQGGVAAGDEPFPRAVGVADFGEVLLIEEGHLQVLDGVLGKVGNVAGLRFQ
jgi:hypothetical protein